MIDLYLKSKNEAEMNTLLIQAELLIETEEGIYPARGINLDIIGPITRIIGYDEANEPITQEYPDWHVNVRANLSAEQVEILSTITIVTPEVPYRVWA